MYKCWFSFRRRSWAVYSVEALQGVGGDEARS